MSVRPYAGRPERTRSLQESPMSKKTKKRKLSARRNKANHGKKPNAGR